MKPLGWIGILLAVLVLGILIVSLFYVFGIWPFDKPYQFPDPRTWKPAADSQAWLQPEYDYGPYKVSRPSIANQEIINNLILALGGTVD